MELAPQTARPPHAKKNLLLLAPITGQLARWTFEDRISTVVEPEDHAAQSVTLPGWRARYAASPSTRRVATVQKRGNI